MSRIPDKRIKGGNRFHYFVSTRCRVCVFNWESREWRRRRQTDRESGSIVVALSEWIKEEKSKRRERPALATIGRRWRHAQTARKRNTRTRQVGAETPPPQPREGAGCCNTRPGHDRHISLCRPPMSRPTIAACARAESISTWTGAPSANGPTWNIFWLFLLRCRYSSKSLLTKAKKDRASIGRPLSTTTKSRTLFYRSKVEGFLLFFCGRSASFSLTCQPGPLQSFWVSTLNLFPDNKLRECYKLNRSFYYRCRCGKLPNGRRRAASRPLPSATQQDDGSHRRKCNLIVPFCFNLCGRCIS